MRRAAKAIYDKIINPPSDDELRETLREADARLPTLWLLGKTGAGKSTLIQHLTGDTAASIGNGFRPCTASTQEYMFPKQHTVIRFLDTRGLGESGYAPEEDIAELANQSDALLVVIRLKDPEQSAVLAALDAIRKSGRRETLDHALVVFSGALEISSGHERERLVDFHQASLKKTLGRTLPGCLVDFLISADGNPGTYGTDHLHDQLATLLPRLHLFLGSARQTNQELLGFRRVLPDILWYAAAAAATDAVPGFGLVTVPAVQGKLLHSLGQKYGVEWDLQTYGGFAAAMGSGFGLAYTASLAGRQIGKLVPGWGQVAGTALSMSISYATTFALGRAACYYLFNSVQGDSVDVDQLQTIYRDALKSARAQGRVEAAAYRE